VDVEDEAVTEEVGKLPSFILDDPSCMGTPVYVARSVKLIGQSKEVKKTVARTGAGGGRVANLPASGVVQVLPSTPTGDPMADDNITVVSAITHWHLSKHLRNRRQRLKWPHFGVPRTAANVRPLMATVKAGVLYFTGSLSYDKELKVAGSVMTRNLSTRSIVAPKTSVSQPPPCSTLGTISYTYGKNFLSSRCAPSASATPLNAHHSLSRVKLVASNHESPA